jgi:hypothetical protein
MTTRRVHSRLRRLGVVVGICAIVSVGLTGCMGSGVTGTTLEKTAIETIRVAKHSTAKIPAEWVLVRDAESSDYNYCQATIDTGPNGSAQWIYGFVLHLKREVPNSTLLGLMKPSGSGWKLQSSGPSEQGGTAMDYIFTDGSMQLWLTVNGQTATNPRIGISATSGCIRNGSTGPGTFPTPDPAKVKG